MESPLPSIPFSLVSKVGAAAWKAAHEAVQSGALVVAQTQFDHAEADLKAYAGEQAKRYLQQIVEGLDLTPRQRVNVLLIYVQAYLNGALDAAATQAGQSRE